MSTLSHKCAEDATEYKQQSDPAVLVNLCWQVYEHLTLEDVRHLACCIPLDAVQSTPAHINAMSVSNIASSNQCRSQSSDQSE